MENRPTKTPISNLLLIVLGVVSVIFISYHVYGPALYYPGIGGIVMIYAAYQGLFKMERYWMEIFAFFLGVITLFYLTFLTSILQTAGLSAIPLVWHWIIIIILDLTGLSWLYKNRHLFWIKQGDTRKPLGAKNEWARLGLLVLGVAVFIAALFSLGLGIVSYALIALLVWSVFVWFILPRMFR